MWDDAEHVEETLEVTASVRDDLDEAIADIWRGDHLVGRVYWDGYEAMIQIFADAHEDSAILSMADLAKAMLEAEPIVTPDGETPALAQSGGVDWEPTNRLVAEFDDRAIHRSAGGEGYFPRDVALEFVDRCNALDLAVVNIEGFDLLSGELKSRPGLVQRLTANTLEPDWPTFREEVNAGARDMIGNTWPNRDSLVVAFEVLEPTGESFVA